ncbi:NADPH-dependent FMN reductase [Pseudomonas sp. 6D_7.1_Bac1]|uniref:NADPH-dependent FMN reductase n=1 Tax=Pseudomonas sp. 6D_7.1_Bac1 TaxID=2971615 RepID=UPI0021C6A5F8|nr:NADPH-dependent FMN reductase [Pseudomonas sp. 6D_7.1_Bac1]MCU1751955.1 NAD(P)H-dependent oxidoreductase [Pseudomonas sp. 6D_7.1_Bac1]
MVQLLAISGSLRAASSNSALLRAAERLSPEGLSIKHYLEVGQLPHFDPDLADDPPQIVAALRGIIAKADGILISCPEYARGIPGSFKNALDWLVASQDFPGKPVALFNASPRASHGQAALRLVLETMSAVIVEPASITVNLLAKGMDEADIAASPQISRQIVSALGAFKHQIEGGLSSTSPD